MYNKPQNPELQYVMPNIMTHTYKVAPSERQLRQLNRQIYEETLQSFYDEECQKPIKFQELVRYLTTNQSTSAIFETSPYNKLLEANFERLIHLISQSEGLISEYLLFVGIDY